jgi:uncharacterized protein YndB with AHSA1/START domain
MPNPLTVTTPTDTTIVVRREFDAPAELVFDCWTIPALIKRWLGTIPGWSMTHCEFDARVGGKWRFVNTGPGGFEMASGGVVKEVERPNRIVMTELYDQDWTGGETLNTNVIEELAPKRSVSTITILYKTKEARDGARATPMAEGMEAGFKVLDAFLAEKTAA